MRLLQIDADKRKVFKSNLVLANSMNKDYVSALISAIKARPELYDSASPRYKCRVGIHLLWNEVAEESGLTGESHRDTNWEVGAVPPS